MPKTGTNSLADKEFIEAIRQGNLESVLRALVAGADLECVDQYGYPGLPLRTACFLGYREIVCELLQRGANIHAANSDGPDAPLRMALRGKHDDIVAILRRQTGDVTGDVSTETDFVMESLVISACYGVDTNVLNGDLLRLSQADDPDPSTPAGATKSLPGDFSDSHPGKFKSWQNS